MNRDGPVLIEAVVNGVASKDSNPNVPRSHAEIRRDIIACFEAGASVVHSHDADGSSGPGDADSYAKTWGPVLEKMPGAIVMTLMPEPDSSRAIGKVSATTPPLEAA